MKVARIIVESGPLRGKGFTLPQLPAHNSTTNAAEIDASFDFFEVRSLGK